MASWSYGMEYHSSGSETGDKGGGSGNEAVPAADRNRSAGDLYRLASLGSGGLPRGGDDADSAASPSLVQSPFQSRHQFVPIQLNLSEGSFSASAGPGTMNEDVPGSAWSAASLAAEASGRVPSAENSRVASAAVLPSLVQPPALPVVPTVAASASEASVQRVDSGSTVLPELLSQTARFSKPSVAAVATPPNYEGMPPAIQQTARRPLRPAAGPVAFPRAPDVPAVPRPHSPPLAVRPAMPSVGTAADTAETAPRYHPTPLEILRMEAAETQPPQPPADALEMAAAESPATVMAHMVPPPPPVPPLRAEWHEPPEPEPVPDVELSVDSETAPTVTVPETSLTVLPSPEPAVVVVPSQPSSSSSSSSSSSLTDDSPRQPSAALTVPTPDAGPSAAQPRLPVADRFFRGLAPLIVQSDFYKTDIKRIACTANFTMVQEMGEYEVSLQRLALGEVSQLEPRVELCHAYETLGRTRRRKKGSASKDSRVPPVTTEDFCAPLVRYDRLLYAVCFCLWGSLLPYNDLVDALTDRFFADMAAEASADVVMRVPAAVLFRWLNDYGVDVLVTTRDRRAASSFCTRRACLVRNGLNEAAPGPRTGSVPSPLNPVEPSAYASAAPAEGRRTARRVLVALEFDAHGNLWGPLTLSRAIRGTVEARKEERAATARARRHRERGAARMAALVRRADRVHAKEVAWETMVAELQRAPAPAPADAAAQEGRLARAHPRRDKSRKTKKRRRGQSTSSTHGEAAEAADEMLLVRPIGARMPAEATDEAQVQVRGTEVVAASARPPTAPVPFANMVYPTVEPTDFGVGPVLSRAASAWLPWTRLRLVLGVFCALLSVVFAIAAVAYVAAHLKTCVYDESTGLCVDSSTASSTSTCAAILSTSLEASPFARRALFGFAAGIGNCLVVCAACALAGLVACVLVAFFSTRAVAVKSLYPRFAYVVYVVHVMLAAIVCAFAAYALSAVVKAPGPLQCRWLPQARTALCAARYAQCPGWRYQLTWPSPAAQRVSLALVACLLAFAALHLFVSFILPMPSAATQQKLAPAVPDTSGFQASYFIPDGVQSQTAARLQMQMAPYLSRALQDSLHESANLVTSTITVAEMMRENREQSIRMMELTKTRRRAGPESLVGRPAVATAAASGTSARHIAYIAVRDPAAARRDADPDTLLRDVAISPQLSSRIRTVQASMHARLATAARPDMTPVGSTTTQPPRRTTVSDKDDKDDKDDDGHTSRSTSGSLEWRGAEEDVETIWREEASASLLRPSRSTPPHSPAEAPATTAAETVLRTTVAVMVHDATDADKTRAEPTTDGSAVEPPQVSILASPSLTLTRRQPSVRVTVAPATSTTTTPSTSTRSSAPPPAPVQGAFGGVAPSTDRRADHHVRTMRDNISQIVRRLEQGSPQVPATQTN